MPNVPSSAVPVCVCHSSWSSLVILPGSPVHVYSDSVYSTTTIATMSLVLQKWTEALAVPAQPWWESRPSVQNGNQMAKLFTAAIAFQFWFFFPIPLKLVVVVILFLRCFSSASSLASATDVIPFSSTTFLWYHFILSFFLSSLNFWSSFQIIFCQPRYFKDCFPFLHKSVWT